MATGPRPKVLIAGMGDTGLLVAIHLSKQFDIIGVSPKPCLVSGQELGTRLTRPTQWKRNYLMDFSAYQELKGVTILQGKIKSLDTDRQLADISLVSGERHQQPYDMLVIASGVSNGFWRTPAVESRQSIEQGISRYSSRLIMSDSVAVIGGGPTGVSVASNLKEVCPDCRVDLFFTRELPLPGYHPKTRRKIARKLQAQGVGLHPHHRARIPEAPPGEFTTGPVTWDSGQLPFTAETVLWATGNLLPNNEFLPEQMLDEKGFVKTDSYLRVPGFANTFAVGDIAATDPNRSSARNGGYQVLANNIDAHWHNRPRKLKTFHASPYRWGSILGVQEEGMQVFTPTGGNVRVPRWWVWNLLFPVFVWRMIYRGVNRRI